MTKTTWRFDCAHKWVGGLVGLLRYVSKTDDVAAIYVLQDKWMKTAF